MSPTPGSPNGGRSSLPLALLAVVVLIWASNSIVTKLALRETTPALLAVVRFSLATTCFHLPLFLTMRRLGPQLEPWEWLRLGAVGVLGQASSTLLFTIGISMTTATFAGLMLMTGPLWTALLAWLVLGEGLGRARAVGMCVAFAGAGVLATGGRLEAVDPPVMLGSAYLMAAQLAWGGYTLMAKPLLARHPPLLVVAAANVFAMLALWPSTALLGAWTDLPRVVDWPASTWLAVLYLVIFTGAGSQVLYIYALRDVSASQAISFMYLQPIFTVALAAVVLAERPTLLTLYCGALILFGLWLVNRPR